MTRSSWVSSAELKPDVYIKCQGSGCNAVIMFNAQEIKDRKAANLSTSTPCRFCNWHPSYPPEPWQKLEGQSF